MKAEPLRRIGRYRLFRRIGRGGMGDVYLAQLEAAGGVRRLAAVKLLLPTRDDARHHQALLAEARLGALLCHPNIVQVLDAGVDGGVSWFAMELVPGLSFSELLEEATDGIPPWTAARIVADACAAVHALHEAVDEKGNPLNVVHRDVTPHNVLISWDGNVKLADLGIAHSALRASVTRSGVIKGKLGYMSPEQASGGAVDRRSDVFALGVQLWEALARRRLFEGQSQSETLASIVRGHAPSLRDMPGVPASLAAVVAGALAIDPAARIASAFEMQRALEEALSGAGVVVGTPEVAQLLARVAPGRVREHLQWLRDPEDVVVTRDDPMSTVARQPRPTAANEPPRRRRRPARFVAGALVGGLAIASLLGLRSGADQRPSPSRPSPSETTIAAAAAPVAPPPAPIAAAAAASPMPDARSDPRESAAAALKSPPRRPPSRRPAPASSAPVSGTLYVSAIPTWATIWIDGKPAGTTPIVLPDVPAGSHTIEALAPERGQSLRRVVTVEAESAVRVEFEFAGP